MAHSYRTLHLWNQWLVQEYLGGHLVDAEHQLLLRLLKPFNGKQALLVGVAEQYRLLHSAETESHALITPLITRQKKKNCIEGDLHSLPILTGSIDIVLLPHTLEFVDNPRQVLSEACRVIRPEGIIAICGFNPYSAWGLCKVIGKRKTTPWNGNFIPSYTIKNWLRLADFSFEGQKSLLFRPPIAYDSIYRKLNFIESVGKVFFPVLGGVYILFARAKVIPLTPIKLKWKQELSKISMPSTMSGHIARQAK